ncbi:hypothetical protein GWK47_054801 [Chionoecetes opilio]|uniref:Uncharacterized protein n=1 Tax=Chionoecetes opilio TaxID=41210 RepID=A0A8J5CRK0_CHIOP|nr:hypothetical protein GWK47_054801 [Chionoecetes opilio]
MDKSKVRIGDKVIKSREDRNLLGRFLIVQGSRPGLVPKFEEIIGKYEMSTVPRSLCAVDRSLYIPTDKASLMHAVEDATVESLDVPPVPDIGQEDPPVKVLIIDAMGVLQSMSKTPNMLKISHLQDAFNKRIETMMTSYDEGRVVFDRYLDLSVENKTRQKRSTTSIEYEVHPEMKLTMSIKELLSTSKTKRSSHACLAKDCLTISQAKIHSCSLSSCGAARKICVWSPDTDVLLLLLDLIASRQIASLLSLKFHTGKGKKKREIDIFERVQVIGRRKCQGLLGLHNFSGKQLGSGAFGRVVKASVTGLEGPRAG